MLIKRIAAPMLAIIALSGCGHYYYDRGPSDNNLIEVSDDTVQQLLSNLKLPFPKGSLLMINPLVNVENLSQTTAFGRIVSDQLASAFHRAGYRIMRMDLPSEMLNKDEIGTLSLTDKAKEILQASGVNALIVGTFASGKQHAYISLRMVDMASQSVIATADQSVNMGPDARALLQTNP